MVEEKIIVEDQDQVIKGESFSDHDEIDEIDSFLSEDVLDLSAEVWSSDDELFPKPKKNQPIVIAKAKSPVRTKPSVKDKVSSNKKGNLHINFYLYFI